MKITLTFIYLFTLSFSGINIFGHPWVTVLALNSAVILCAQIITKGLQFDRNDFIFLLFFISLLASMTINNNEKTLNYLLGLPVSLYLILYKAPLQLSKFSSKEQIFRYIAVSGIFVACTSIFEQIAYFWLGVSIFHELPRFHYQIASYNAISYRSYAFSMEPSHLANYLLLTLPFVNLVYGKKFIMLIVIGILPTFSASGLMLGLTAFTFYTIVSLFNKGNKKKIKSIATFTSGVIIFLYAFLYLPLFDVVISKITLDLESVSAMERMERVLTAIEMFKSAPFFGVGPGYWSLKYGVSPNNFYLMIVTEAGIFSLALILLYFLNISFSRKSQFLEFDKIRVYLFVVGLGFGLFTGEAFALIGVIFLTLYNN